MLVLLRGHLLSGAILWKARAALNPRRGVHSCAVWQALTSVDFSPPYVTWGAFRLLFRTAGMKCTNMRWLLSTLPFPLAEIRSKTSDKVQSLSDELQGAKLGVHFSFWGQAQRQVGTECVLQVGGDGLVSRSLDQTWHQNLQGKQV